jgi:aminopeptidase N
VRTLWLLLCFCLAAPAGAAASPEDVPRGRLPEAATPVAYRIDLTVVPERERFRGHVEIDVDLKTAATTLFLHGRGLAVKEAVLVQGGRRITAAYKQLEPLGTAQLTFAEPPAAGRATLIVDYDAPFGDGPAGLYRIKVGDDWYAWSQFEAIEARAAFPSFDQPGYKTPFTVTLTTKPGHLAVSNAPETGEPAPAGELVRHTFAPTQPLPTYLVAFAVGPFASVSGVAPPTAIRKTPLPLRIIATRPQAGKLAYALAETPRIVELLETYFGAPFPFPKLDQIASPVLGGAMENAGADMYDDRIILLDPNAPIPQKQNFGMIVAHELAHQWFGDDVTPAWWDDLWLNESFANWMGYRIGSEWRPDLNIGSNASLEVSQAMKLDAFEAGRPIRQPILADGEIDSAFDAITYGKGGQVIAMIADYLGDEKFREGVRLHLRRHPYGTATTEDFFAALADAAQDPRVLKAMQGFVAQQGVPVVDVSREGTGFVATQARYTTPGAPRHDTQWVIPFCVRRGDTRSCTLLDQRRQAISADGTGPLVPNAGGSGYYRYNLAPADWDALIGLGGTLPAGEALAALDSLGAQFQSGGVTAAQVIHAARAFAANADANVAIESGLMLVRWHSRGWIPAASLPKYRRLVQRIYGPRLTAIGFEPREGAHGHDAPDTQKLRQDLVALLADEAEDPAVRRALRMAAGAWLQGNTRALDQAFYEVALRVHVQDGTIAGTRALFEALLKTDDEQFRDAALAAVGSSRRPADARWLLDRLTDPRIRPTDRLRIVSALMATAETRDLTFEWLKGHYDVMAAGAAVFLANDTASLPGVYCSVEKAADAERFLRPKVRESGRGELAFDRMLDSIRTCGTETAAKTAEIVAALP